MGIVEQIKQNRQDSLNGILQCIPWSGALPMLSTRVPGIMKGVPYLVTAHSGVGKTQFAKFAFVYTAIEHAIKFKLKLKINVYALEESIEEFQLSLLSYLIFKETGHKIAPLDLSQKYTVAFSDELMRVIEKQQKILDLWLSYINIVDHLYTPSEIYKDIFNQSLREGMHYYKHEEGGELIDFNEYRVLPDRKGWVHHSYKPRDKHLHKIILLDHISLLQEEYDVHTQKMLSKHATLKYWSFNIVRKKLTKIMNYSAVTVQQQSAAGENVDHKNAKMLEPSLANLADNKTTQRDAMVILGVFDPHRHGIEEFNRHDITHYKDTFRSISVLKNRYGKSSGKVSMLFLGIVNYFKEL